MAKSNTTICIDEGIIKELKARGVNISKLANDFFISYLGSAVPNTSLEKVDNDIMHAEAKVLLLNQKKEQIIKLEEELKKQRGVPFKVGHLD